jgi:hypothetical protein
VILCPRTGLLVPLKPRCDKYVGPYQITERKGEVAYKIQFPEDTSTIFLVFHVSQLKKCLRVPEERIEAKDLKIGSDLVYQEQPVDILDTKDQITRNITVKTYKVLWNTTMSVMQRGRQMPIYKKFTPIFTKKG